MARIILWQRIVIMTAFPSMNFTRKKSQKTVEFKNSRSLVEHCLQSVSRYHDSSLLQQIDVIRQRRIQTAKPYERELLARSELVCKYDDDMLQAAVNIW